MKLDSIVYDYSSLQEALAKTLNDESPTFKAIYPSDTATSLVNVLASYGSMLEYQLVSAMANMYTDSAYSEAGVYQLAETLGNRIHGNISSEIYCTIERTNLRGVPNVIIPAGSKFIIGALSFFNPEDIWFSINEDTVHNIKLIQGNLQTAEFITSGISGERFYFCDDFKCNTNNVKVYIQDVEWSITDSFLPYVVTDNSVDAEAQVVIVRTDPSGRSYVKFGNNTNGIIPSKGSKLRVEYISNEGANGNLDNNQVEINLNTPIYHTLTNGSRVRLEVDITATSTALGGFNTQSLDVLRESSPYVFGSGQRAVRRNDYKAMLLNQCGYLTCNVWGEYEEAAINGGYDKIMMNMVYYTGIKSIQKYDLQPVTTLSLSLAQFQNADIDFYEVYGNVNSARGFLGSYMIDVSSYTSDNTPISIKYRDASGNNILTCDPSVNKVIGINDFESEIYPVNDFDVDALVKGTLKIDTNQWITQSEVNNPELLIKGGYVKSSGLDRSGEGQQVIISWDSPFQIMLDYENPISLAAIALKTPVNTNDAGFFPHKLAIYGTDADVTDTSTKWYDNVKNNSKWIKLTGIQTIDNTLSIDQYSDWITTNIYNPGSSTVIEENIVNSTEEEGGQRIDDNHFVLKTLVDDDYNYTVKVDGITQSSDTYTIADKILTFASAIPITSTIVVYGTINDWNSYKHYVIEIYEIQDSSIRNPNYVALQQIKAIYKNSASTINYTQNNAIKLNIPIKTLDNIVYAYTRPFITPLNRLWLTPHPYKNSEIIGYDPEDPDTRPDLTKTFFVQDFYTNQNTIELVNPGKAFMVNEILYIPYYEITIAIKNPEQNNTRGFKVGETFKVDNRYVIITEVDENGKIIEIKFTEGCEYTGSNEYIGQGKQTDLIIEPGTYSGKGEGGEYLEFIIVSTGEIGRDELAIQITEVDENGSILAFNTIPENAITQYCAAGNSIELEPSSQESYRENAIINVTSTTLTDYDNKGFDFNAITDAYNQKNVNIKTLSLPNSMQFYEYTVVIDGANETNGYRTNDVLTYSTVTDNYTYVFEVKINNISSQVFTTTLQIDTNYPTTILRGKSGINVTNASLSGGTAGASGATITISAEPTVKVTASYTGNYYTNNDIQAFDLPILNKYNHFTTYMEFKQPKIKNTLIEIDVEYENVSTYQTTKANIIKNVNALFDLKPFSIGKTLNVSDIWKVVNNTPGVKRFIVTTPIDNLDCMPYELINLPAENLIINDVINNEYK